MKVEIDIDTQSIIDVLVTALEGGSNYWYNLPDLSAIKRIKWEKSYALSEKVGKAVLEHGAVIPVYDLEDDDIILGNISQDNIKRGLQLFIENGNEWDDCMDAGEADTFFQYVVMAEIVFG